MSVGQVVQCIGAVVDIQFPRNDMPRVYEALLLEDSGEKSFAEKGLIFKRDESAPDIECLELTSGGRQGRRDPHATADA